MVLNVFFNFFFILYSLKLLHWLKNHRFGDFDRMYESSCIYLWLSNRIVRVSGWFEFFHAKKKNNVLYNCACVGRTQNTWWGWDISGKRRSMLDHSDCLLSFITCSVCCCRRHLHYCLSVWTPLKSLCAQAAEKLNWISTKFWLLSLFVRQISMNFEFLFALQIFSVWALGMKFPMDLCHCTSLRFSLHLIWCPISLPIVFVCRRYAIVLQFGRAVTDISALIFDKQWHTHTHSLTHIDSITINIFRGSKHKVNKRYYG